ncbi:MAG: bifunctional pyr operon transcriptional regulator/uracil phosphoribosyltransferase PyrR [Pseudomonadales bacterium]
MPLADIDSLLDDLYDRLSARISERNLRNPLLVGIHTGGSWIAERLYPRLVEAGLISDPLGSLDISFYRDDFTRIGLNPKVKPSDLPVASEDRHIILVDDVLMSGRTIRAALNVLFDLGRPASVTLVTLFDLDANELPIRADIVGQHLQLPSHQRIKLTGPEPLGLEIQEIEP